MREALYHPTFGYYARKVRRIGAGGDFSTSATLHDALPRALATWATAHRARVKQRDGSWHVIELGGGGGEMAAGFLGALGWLARRRLRYHIVEVSTPLRALQQQKTVRYPGVTHWHATIQEALAAADGRALILSNEFVDAFPCIQLSRNGEGDHSWSEVMVAWPDDSPHPTERLEPCGWPDVNPPPDSSVMRSDFLDAAVSGQRVEIHRSYQQWLAGWVPQWKSGTNVDDRLRRRGVRVVPPPAARNSPGLRASPANRGTGNLPELRTARPNGGCELHRPTGLGRAAGSADHRVERAKRVFGALVVQAVPRPGGNRSRACFPP